jgi:hypothetical protein
MTMSSKNFIFQICLQILRQRRRLVITTRLLLAKLKYDLFFFFNCLKVFFPFKTDPFQGLDISRLSVEDVITRSRLLDNEVKVCIFNNLLIYF